MVYIYIEHPQRVIKRFVVIPRRCTGHSLHIPLQERLTSAKLGPEVHVASTEPRAVLLYGFVGESRLDDARETRGSIHGNRKDVFRPSSVRQVSDAWWNRIPGILINNNIDYSREARKLIAHHTASTISVDLATCNLSLRVTPTLAQD